MTQDELDALPIANGTFEVMDDKGHITIVRDRPIFLLRGADDPVVMLDRERRLWSVGRGPDGVLYKQRNHALEAAVILGTITE